MRTFEIPACKGFSISTQTSEQNDILNENINLISFKSLDDLKSKIQFFLTNEIDRKRIADNAYNLITKFHTYDHRVKKIINLYENRL